MVKASSRKQSAIVAGRPRRSPKNTLAVKGPRTIKHQTASVTSRLPVSETLLGMSEQEGREIAVAIAANLTSEGVSAFSDELRLEILRRSPRDAKGNIIKSRECGRPEDLKHFTFDEIRYLPLKRCLLCGYIGSRGHTTARHSAAHGDHDRTIVDVPWQVCLVKDAVPSGSMGDFCKLVTASSGHKPMIAYRQADATNALDPYPGSATCTVSATGKYPSVSTGVASPTSVSPETSPASVTTPPFSPSPACTVSELEMAPPTAETNIDPLLLGPFGDPFFLPSSYCPFQLDFVNAAAEINIMLDQSEQFAAFEPYSRDDDNEGIRGTRAWNHLTHGGKMDYTPLITVY